jgi:protein TonB
VARSNEMADETPQPVPDFSDIRPTRANVAATADGTTVTRVLGSADPAFAPGIPTRDRARFVVSGSIAATAHVLLLIAFIAAPPGEFGSGGTSVDAISVSIISAAALESREPSPNLAARAAPDQIAPREGDSETVSQAAPDKPEQAVQPPKREPAEPPPVETEKEVVAEPAVPDAPAMEKVPDVVTTVIAPPKPPEKAAEPKVALVEPPPPERQPEKPKEEKPTEETSTPSPDAAAAGGAPSRGVAPDLPPASAAATASRGDVNAYGLEVQAALLAADQRQAKARLAATGAKGTVVLRIVIAGDGALERAEIQISSGHRHLDEAAVQLVRLTAFPRPPASLTADQRAYIAPIVFR